MTQSERKNPNRKTKDTLFTKLFEDVENQKKLYQDLFDENKKGAKTKEEIFSSLRKTIDFCIENNILTDFLIRHRKEVMDFMISIFAEEQLRAMEKKEDFEEGLERGIEQGIKQGILKIA